MITFLYQCPTTGLKVQGLVSSTTPQNAAETYQTVSCIACQQVHLVNPKTGKTPGTDETGSISAAPPKR